MNKKVSTLIIVKNDEILLLRRSKISSGAGLWNFPGGSVEEGESLETAAVRELKEEANLDVKESDVIYLGNFVSRYLTINFFITDKFENEVKINKESDDYNWVKLKDFPNYKFVGGGTLHPKLLQNIKDFMEGKIG